MSELYLGAGVEVRLVNMVDPDTQALAAVLGPGPFYVARDSYSVARRHRLKHWVCDLRNPNGSGPNTLGVPCDMLVRTDDPMFRQEA
jgi:hypothetical protein